MSATPNTAAEHIAVIADAPDPAMRWQPSVGRETRATLQRAADLDDAARQRVEREAARILGQCVPPTESGGTTGLVLGQVQSGKTLSFTTVAAMARDNRYRIVIVITGTTTTLLGQSVARLKRDLGIEQVNRGWKHVPVVPREQINREAIADALDGWNQPFVPANQRRTLLITVMKHHGNLQRLINLLSTFDLRDVPTLVIDDEADQASLNNQVRQNRVSTTYQRLLGLRAVLPRHTFLQYTATPQALLLINIIDALSPAFVEVLEPGENYTGGHAFFVARPETVREIPPGDLPNAQQPLAGPPETLFEAMRLFFLGVAAALREHGGEQGNRSMMIHPSQATDQHAQFMHWVTQTRDEWRQILGLTASDPVREELLDEFRHSHADLRATVPSLPALDDLIPSLLYALSQTRVEMLNTRGGQETPTVDWNDSFSYILVGGNAMDRGFTVRGLTVTYMPRPLGGGNADTLQQRARFFGYKRPYLDYCRVYLPGDVLQAFRRYVEHEDDLRARLAQHRRSGQPLTTWPRAFRMSQLLKPTRDSVIDIPWQRARIGGRWFWTRSPHWSPDAVAENRRVVNALRGAVQFADTDGHPARTSAQRHLVAQGLSLRQVYQDLLAPLRFPSFIDSQDLVSHLVILREIIERQPDLRASVYLMSRGELRERSADDRDRVLALFQGANPVNPPSQRGSVYPGDEAMRADDEVTVQLHFLTVLRATAPQRIENVPTLAVWVPPRFAQPLVTQPQGQQP